MTDTIEIAAPAAKRGRSAGRGTKPTTLSLTVPKEPEFVDLPASPRELAAAMLREADGDVRAATSKMFDAVIDDTAFIHTHLKDIIRSYCYEAVAGQIRATRRVVWATPQPTTEERRAKIDALAAGTALTLLDFQLPGGKRLGDAARSEVAEAADVFGKMARDLSWKSRWLEHVAQSLPEGSLVRDVMSAERLEELRQEVSR